MTESEYKEMIYKKAETVKTEPDLLAFLKEIRNTITITEPLFTLYGGHEGGLQGFNNSPNGGITGFQAGCLGWECIHEFMSVKLQQKFFNTTICFILNIRTNLKRLLVVKLGKTYRKKQKNI
jgi:hypothetical protein